MCVFACIYVCVPCVCLVPTEERIGVRPLKLELQMVVSHHMGAGN